MKRRPQGPSNLAQTPMTTERAEVQPQGVRSSGRGWGDVARSVQRLVAEGLAAAPRSSRVPCC
ncbi:hypothetical protein ES332_D03G060900v1 [Gossypium tomentosum]|uniref:Uncharacterized protein n=1 Tax=Gossypium tomentosum TaxID=34277 RepID=A0A5D2LJA9_GOSTO|nr:hypothetical protein ES332_D03G060900v1 [Gossypium tomentosum]